MNGRFITIAVALIVLMLDAAPNKPVLTEKERRLKMEARDAAEGGRLQIGARGRVAVVLAPGLTSAALEEEVHRFSRTIHIQMEIISGGFTLNDRKAALSATGAAATVFFAEDPSLPMSLLAMEEHWAFVNVARLKSDNPSAGILDLRLRKMFMRSLLSILGAAHSRYPANPIKPVSTIKDLDSLPEPIITIDAAIGMSGYMPGIGLERYESMTYKEACEEGIAPPPTNDIQKVIFEQVKSDKERGPTNPITIKPPKKK